LPAEARAALVAAVRGVSVVVIAGSEQWQSSMQKTADLTIIDDLEDEKRRSEEFIEFVLKRQEASQCPSS
jgi:anti-sigma factor ChrR (cupin superfamily)